MTDLAKLELDLINAIGSADSVAAVGKSGSVSGLLKGMGALSPDDRREQGPIINGLRDRHEVLKEARGIGCLVAIELQQPSGGTKKVAWDAVHAMHASLFPQLVVMPMLSRHNIITQVTGSHDPIIRLMPPFVISDDDIRWFVDALDDVLARSHRLPGPMIEMGRNAVRAKLRGRSRGRAEEAVAP